MDPHRIVALFVSLPRLPFTSSTQPAAPVALSVKKPTSLCWRTLLRARPAWVNDCVRSSAALQLHIVVPCALLHALCLSASPGPGLLLCPGGDSGRGLILLEYRWASHR